MVEKSGKGIIPSNNGVSRGAFEEPKSTLAKAIHLSSTCRFDSGLHHVI